MEIKEGTIPEKKQSYFKVAFVRNPFTRLISCYRNKVVNTQLMEKKYKFLGVSLIKHRMPFEAFVEVIVDLPDELINDHFRRQTEYICPLGRKLVFDFVGRFENLAEDWRYIAERFDFEPHLVHHNQSTPQEGTTGKEDYRSYYTSVELVDTVYRYYEEDIRLFGYEKDYQDLRGYVNQKQVGVCP